MGWFWNDYIKPKYGDKAKPCYTDTDTLIAHMKTESVYADIAGEQRFYTSTYEVQIPLPMGEYKKK